MPKRTSKTDIQKKEHDKEYNIEDVFYGIKNYETQGGQKNYNSEVITKNDLKNKERKKELAKSSKEELIELIVMLESLSKLRDNIQNTRNKIQESILESRQRKPQISIEEAIEKTAEGIEFLREIEREKKEEKQGGKRVQEENIEPMNLEKDTSSIITEDNLGTTFEAATAAKRLGATLATARKQAGLSQDALAKRMGTGQTAVGRIETGDTNPTLESLQKYASALGLRLRIDLEGPD